MMSKYAKPVKQKWQEFVHLWQHLKTIVLSNIDLGGSLDVTKCWRKYFVRPQLKSKILLVKSLLNLMAMAVSPLYEDLFPTL